MYVNWGYLGVIHASSRPITYLLDYGVQYQSIQTTCYREPSSHRKSCSCTCCTGYFMINIHVLLACEYRHLLNSIKKSVKNRKKSWTSRRNFKVATKKRKNATCHSINNPFSFPPLIHSTHNCQTMSYRLEYASSARAKCKGQFIKSAVASIIIDHISTISTMHYRHHTTMQQFIIQDPSRAMVFYFYFYFSLSTRRV